MKMLRFTKKSIGKQQPQGFQSNKQGFIFTHTIILICLSFAKSAEARNTTTATNRQLYLTNFTTQGLPNVSELFPNIENETNGSNIAYKVGLSILLGSICTVTVLGNLIVIFTAILFRQLRTIPNMFIISLASADLLMGTIVLPMWSHYVIGDFKWSLGFFWCDVWTSIDVLSVTASIGTLCAISLDRFVAITMPFKYATKMTRPRARFIIGFIWMVSGTIAFVPINLGWWKTNKPEDLECYDSPTCCEFRPNVIYAVVSSCISFYIPLIIMICAYSVVFKIAIQKRGVLPWEKREHRAVITMGIIMGTFVVCWLPFFIVNIAQVFCQCVASTPFLMVNCLGYTNSLFNPIIYCRSEEFRKAFKRVLMCGLCREGFQQTSRASLSSSYALRSRSRVRTESILSQVTSLLLTGGNSAKRRTSRLSNVSGRSNRASPVNGRVSPACNSSLRPGEPRTLVYGLRSSTSRQYESDTHSDGTTSNGMIPLHIVGETSTSVNGFVTDELYPQENTLLHMNGRNRSRPSSGYMELTPDVCKKFQRRSSSADYLHGRVSSRETNDSKTNETYKDQLLFKTPS
uniref:beta-2 adrenergic receptor n=1 Tax=Ciona intestinalis TaxID=7719 RepID=UPI000EF52B7E|nr:beta-2 adrenergic receptor [Ciona intestinalis]|eukprot:XP_026696555.1 beta-2 adrenergic receptor [Ciona intestinalis]